MEDPAYLAEEYANLTDQVPEWSLDPEIVMVPQTVVEASASEATGAELTVCEPDVAVITHDPPLSDTLVTNAVPEICDADGSQLAPGENTEAGEVAGAGAGAGAGALGPEDCDGPGTGCALGCEDADGDADGLGEEDERWVVVGRGLGECAPPPAGTQAESEMPTSSTVEAQTSALPKKLARISSPRPAFTTVSESFN
ncbi:MAG: hypothetical protein JWM49_2987 [Microbacteriaceae bacterium]|nr:hypothetical protein [Microbacteriaceae bacterium]